MLGGGEASPVPDRTGDADVDFYYLDFAEARLAGAFLLAETGRLVLVATAFLRAVAGRLTVLEAAFIIFFTVVAIVFITPIDSC